MVLFAIFCPTVQIAATPPVIRRASRTISVSSTTTTNTTTP